MDPLIVLRGKLARAKALLGTRVSIVIPAFNAANWIAETIASVLQQTYKDIEVIVVDDGSTDETADVAKGLLSKGPFPYRIIKQANAGLSEARNTGLHAANSEWIQFLDADDLLHPEKIKLQVEACRRGPSIDVVYSDWQKLKWDGKDWKPNTLRTPMIGSHVLADLLKDKNWQQVGSQVFKLETVKKIGGYDKTAEPVEDMELCLRIATAGGKFMKVPSKGPIFWYRDRAGSLSKSWAVERHVERCIKNAKLVENVINTGAVNKPAAIDAITEVYLGAARYFAARNWQRFDEIVGDIEALKPGFIPERPRILGLLSRAVGYRKAERVAAQYRKAKHSGMRWLKAGAQGATKTNAKQENRTRDLHSGGACGSN
jgi:glycosyltransferase involved in cell wall biosynthesis